MRIPLPDVCRAFASLCGLSRPGCGLGEALSLRPPQSAGRSIASTYPRHVMGACATVIEGAWPSRLHHVTVNPCLDELLRAGAVEHVGAECKPNM